MNTDFPDLQQTTKRSHVQESTQHCVFDDLRRRLAQETPGMGLSNLIESVNAMQRACNVPGEFDLRFEEFVYRAENYTAAVRPFFPALVRFLSSREEGGEHEGDPALRAGSPARVA